MKKKNIFKFLFGSLFAMAGLSSCDDGCQTCTYTYSNGQTYSYILCEEDFSSKAKYKEYIKYVESTGYDCK